MVLKQTQPFHCVIGHLQTQLIKGFEGIEVSSVSNLMAHDDLFNPIYLFLLMGFSPPKKISPKIKSSPNFSKKKFWGGIKTNFNLKKI
jgi:hypothetical protein